jgi:MerR family transcriptional regulator, copper efflux regulator
LLFHVWLWMIQQFRRGKRRVIRFSGCYFANSPAGTCHQAHFSLHIACYKERLLDARHVRREYNNYRDYGEEAAEHLLLIKEVQAAGFTLSEFKELDQACQAADELLTQKAATFLRRKTAEVSEKIAELERVQAYLAGKLADVLQE